MEGSKGATTARWRGYTRYGGSAHRQNFGEAEREIEGEREHLWHQQIAYLSYMLGDAVAVVERWWNNESHDDGSPTA